jgi:hypothetical protein
VIPLVSTYIVVYLLGIPQQPVNFSDPGLDSLGMVVYYFRDSEGLVTVELAVVAIVARFTLVALVAP